MCTFETCSHYSGRCFNHPQKFREFWFRNRFVPITSPLPAGLGEVASLLTPGVNRVSSTFCPKLRCFLGFSPVKEEPSRNSSLNFLLSHIAHCPERSESTKSKGGSYMLRFFHSLALDGNYMLRFFHSLALDGNYTLRFFHSLELDENFMLRFFHSLNSFNNQKGLYHNVKFSLIE